MSIITNGPAPTPANWVGYSLSSGNYVPSSCDSNSIWSATGTMGRCCPVGGVCLFYRSCDGVTAVEAASGLKVACTSTSLCATETIFQQWPDVSPLSHIICVTPGYKAATAYRQLATDVDDSSTKASSSASAAPASTTKLNEPTPTSALSNTSPGSSSNSNKGVIIGAAVGAVLLVLILAALVGVVFYFKKRVSALTTDKGDGSDGAASRGVPGGENTSFAPGDYPTYPLTKPFAYPSSQSTHSFQMGDQNSPTPQAFSPAMQTLNPAYHPGLVELSAVPHHKEAWELPDRSSSMLRASMMSNMTAERGVATQVDVRSVNNRTAPNSVQGTPVQSPSIPVATPVVSPVIEKERFA